MRRHDIVALFPEFTLDLDKLTLLPPLARRLGRWSALLYPHLANIRILRGHYIGILRRGHLREDL